MSPTVPGAWYILVFAMAKKVGPSRRVLRALPLAFTLAGCPAFVQDDYEFGDNSSEGGGGCAGDETAFEARCYFVTSSYDDYDGSLASCESRGAGWGLVEIGSQAEHDFVGDLAGGSEAWLGATDRDSEGYWFWNSGAPLWEGDAFGTCLAAYCQWDMDEPNDNESVGDCARLVGDYWRDSPCDEVHVAVCEGPG